MNFHSAKSAREKKNSAYSGIPPKNDNHDYDVTCKTRQLWITISFSTKQQYDSSGITSSHQ